MFRGLKYAVWFWWVVGFRNIWSSWRAACRRLLSFGVRPSFAWDSIGARAFSLVCQLVTSWFIIFAIWLSAFVYALLALVRIAAIASSPCCIACAFLRRAFSWDSILGRADICRSRLFIALFSCCWQFWKSWVSFCRVACQLAALVLSNIIMLASCFDFFVGWVQFVAGVVLLMVLFFWINLFWCGCALVGVFLLGVC